ncbi:reverse transcriptase family protein [Niabella insulamsoli]|uniref:reverse transcriptase family protein n=1 Tax=Niabella insulamsoli TaxID=3144874 RepID=UPI0031FDC760
MTFPLEQFLVDVKALDHSDDYQKDITDYINNLQSQKLPVIFSLPHLCILAGVSIPRMLDGNHNNYKKNYKRFKLRKKRGGFRYIHVPDGELKFLQRWILQNILEKIDSHVACKGFDKEASILKNAEVHLNKEAILKIDLQRFYDSINEKRVFGIFKSVGYHSNLAVSLAKICTFLPSFSLLNSFTKTEKELKDKIQQSREGILPQGAPTSPKLANLISRRLDKRIAKLAERRGLSYSRYADDLTLSGNYEELRAVKKGVFRIITGENFYVNNNKTKLLRRGNRFLVTGLSVHNNAVSVPKAKKRVIEHHLFHCNDNGVEQHLKTASIKNRNFKDWLLGNIAFVFSIEKELGEKYFEQFNKINWPI